MNSKSLTDGQSETGVAIIGMSGRFPGAGNIDAFWENLKNGVDSISRFTDAELEFSNAGEPGAKIVKARAILENVEMFDAAFFGIYPKEAEVMDPQHRVFLECAWETLESAGYDSEAYPGLIGVYAGLSLNTYLLCNLAANREFAEKFTGSYQVGEYQTMLGNDKDFLPTRVSYKLNLRGPSMDIQCACSTSLVAISQACLGLLNYQADMALAGGVSITFPQKRDYLYQEDGMVSIDGTCRTFDALAQGTVFGHGAGVLLLKRLSDALADGDHIYAVIKGSAVNNDGSMKIGYAAPSVQSQAEVIAQAQAAAGVDADSISYVEAHGTGTPLGDPIEVEALTKAFRASTSAIGFCALGSAKTNIGHLDVAAGVTGVIKTVLSLQNNLIPPLLHFQKPNPRIDFANSPFYPVAKLLDWKPGDAPRRAGVSAFGVGGTNAHVIIEEAPAIEPSSASRPHQLILLSARTPSALDQMSANLAAHLERNPGINLADAAYTLQKGRRAFSHRRILVCRDAADAATTLKAADARRVFTREQTARNPPVVFMFPGQGAQYVNMGLELYQTEPVFRTAIDQCAEILQPRLGVDLRSALYPAPGRTEAAEEQINQTHITQPAIAVTEYALARLWMSWGIIPQALVGHSIGEYVAACLAGVFTLEDALGLLAERALLMAKMPGGAMLAVRLSAKELEPLLGSNLSLAAINGPSLSVVSGPRAALEAFQSSLGNVASRFLPTSHAFHSAMMDPILEPFTRAVEKVRRNTPTIPWISTLTGDWVTTADMADASYWSRQLRQTVRLTDALGKLVSDPARVFVEVGPGQTLAALARQHPEKSADQVVLASLAQSQEPGLDVSHVLTALGRLWLAGAELDWKGFHAGERRLRVPLPTYPFERKKYWVEPVKSVAPMAVAQVVAVSGAALDATPDSSVAEPAPAAVPETTPASRLERISLQLRQSLKALSGLDLSAIGPSASFVELGFDSLFLTQASQSFQQQFGVKITFRQLLDDLSSIAALAAYLDAKLPPDAFPAVATAVAADPMVRSAGSTIRSAIKAPTARTEAEKEFKRFGPYKPVEKGVKGGLTPHQQQCLDELTARYTKKTPGSKSYTAEHRRHFADPRSVSGFKSNWKEMVYPIVAARSSGSRIWDIDGNEFIDVTMGFGLNFFGHSPAFVTEAVSEQLKLGVEIGPQNPLAGKIAKMLCEFTGMERVTFCNTGSEAVMAAIRLARTVTGRTRVAFFTGDYHGTFDEVLVRGSWVDGEYRSNPIAPGIPPSLVENMLVLEYGSAESLEILKSCAGELAAVMVEPVQSRQPDLQPREFLHQVRALTEKSGTALIFDEVVTGFRCHPGGAQAVFGVRADIATYGKVLGGGLPIGIIAGKAMYMDALDGGNWEYGDDSYPGVGVTFFAGTFVRHPLAMAAAWAVLNRLKAEGPQLQERLNARVAAFVASLNAHFEQIRVPIRLPHFSSFFYIEHAHDLKQASLLWYYMREKGVHVWEGRPCFITLAHTDEDLEFVARVFKESVAEMQAAGFLPATPDVSESLGTPGAVPLTEAEREIWLSAQMSSDANCSYNESSTLYFEGDLNVPALHQSLQKLVDRHDALRATFAADGQSQQFTAALALALPLVDLSSLETADRDARFAEIVSAEARTPFDLRNGPLVRVQLVKLAPQNHRLLFTAHHLACDGWSFGVLVSELSRLYNEALGGERAALAPAMQFADYARLQEEGKNRPEVVDSEAYWLNQFSDGAPVLELPADHPRPVVKSYNGAMISRFLDPARFKQLKKVSAQRGGTLFVTLLAGFNVLLHRLGGQDDIVVGIPAAGQSLVGGNDLVGHCLNFLPTRCQLDGSRSFTELTSRIKKSVLDAYDHQECTYGTLVRKLKLPRDTSRLPLVSVMFNIDRSAAEKTNFAGLKFDIATNAKRYVNFDLFFNLVQSEDNLKVECEFNTDLFDRATLERWLSHFETLIQGIIDDPGQSLSDLPLLTDSELARITGEWNDTAADYPRHQTIHGLFGHHAAQTPDAPAVRFENQRLTYGELAAQSGRLAAHLRKLGVKPGVLAGICVERSPAMIVGVLAILQAGGAYVPMDPAFPRDRLGYMIEDARMPVLLTERKLVDDLPAHNATLVCLDEFFAAPEAGGGAGEMPITPATSDDLAYVIFTSGSTGRPKGVEITHRAVVNFLNSMRRLPGLRADDVLLAVTTLSFDIAGLELFLPLTTGACVAVAGREAVADGNQLLRLLKATGATVMQATPATWRLLLEAGWRGSAGLKILVGGEACPRELANALVSEGVSVWNMYGPTETTIWSAVERLEVGNGPVSIGRPIDNTQIYLVGPNLRPVPVGVAGELLIGGDGLARGYLDRPELTAEKFIADPFSEIPGARLYRTGDLARYLPDGRIECLGRIDQQVKIRGFRIELGEIESVLGAHPAVRECVVVARADATGQKRLVAYLATAPENAPTANELRVYLARKLPDYMVPGLYEFMDALPRTPNGKVNRNALPSPDAQARRAVPFVPPRNPTEQILAGIWAEVLGLQMVSVEDNLFDLGADSIHLFQITARSNQAGLKLVPQQLLEHRNISGLARMLAANGGPPAETAAPGIVRVSRDSHRVRRGAS